MNKKNYLLFLGVLISSILISCSKDGDDDDNGGGRSGSIGVLVGDDEEANALLEGVRVASVGSDKYYYSREGVLDSMEIEGDMYKVKGSKIIMELNEEHKEGYVKANCTFNISNNRVVSFSLNMSDKGSSYGYPYWSKIDESGSFSYNSKGQIVSITGTSTEEVEEDGEYTKETIKAKLTFNYSSDNRLLSIMQQYDGEEGGDKSVEYTDVTCGYTSGVIENKFYQYTPYMLDVFEDSYIKGLAYVGLLGRASSCIPSEYVTKWEEVFFEDGEEDKESGSYSRTSSVTFNNNGTISKADGKNYSYTSVGTRAVQPEVIPENTGNKRVKSLFSHLRHHRHGRKVNR